MSDKVWYRHNCPNKFLNRVERLTGVSLSPLIPNDVEFNDKVLIPISLYGTSKGNAVFQYEEYNRFDEELDFIFFDSGRGIFINEYILNTPDGEYIALDWRDLTELYALLRETDIIKESVFTKLYRLHKITKNHDKI